MAVVLAAGLAVPGGRPAAGAPDGAGEYHPLPPVRILDTRTGVGGVAGPVGPGSFEVTVLGAGGVPATGVAAVVLNVTAVGPTASPSFLTVWPGGTPRPTASNLNFVAGQTVPNLVTAKVGANGKVAVYNEAGSVHVLFDVAGWYGTSAAPDGARYTPLTPARVLDTRTAIGGHPRPLTADETVTVPMRGQGGVPPSGVSAVVVNATVVDATGHSFLTLYPAGGTRPVVSNLNYVPGQTVPNLAVVKLGADGQLSAYNQLGGAHLIFDVLGWFGDDGAAPGSIFNTLPPARILDTRTPIGGLQGPVGPGATINALVSGAGGVPPQGADAVVVNATVTQPTAAGYVTLWPTGTPQPTASNLNFVPGQNVPNLAVIKVGTGGAISLFNAFGTTHLILDVVGWYSTPASDPDPDPDPPPTPPAPSNPTPPSVTPPPPTSCNLGAAPPLDPTATPTLFESTAFLHSGPSPRQQGVAAGAVTAGNAALLHGRVLDGAGAPVSGATITTVGRPELGSTATGSDGCYAFVAAAPGPLTASFAKSGALPVQRAVAATAGTSTGVEDVTLTALDTAATSVSLSESTTAFQVHRGSPVTDSDGGRRATLLFPPSTTATMKLPGGASQPVTSGTVRATEFTVGDRGPSAMPGSLPVTSGYTYAVELSLDEAMAAGATEVRFNHPVPNYTENFLGFPAGTPVPTGYYDRVAGRWIGAPNGRVVAVVAEAGGRAELDVTGDGAADTGAALGDLGVTDGEREQLAQLYDPGISLWRVPIDHFTPWDHNWPFGPPDDARGPEDGPDQPEDCPCSSTVGGSVIEVEAQGLGEVVPIQGTAYSLTYNSLRAPGYKPSSTVRLPVSRSVPASLKRIDVTLQIAGRTFRSSYPPAPNQDLTFTWDGLDGFGRRLTGDHPLAWRVEYVYDGVYRNPADFAASFARLGGVPISGSRERVEVTLSKSGSIDIGAAPSPTGAGPWSFNVHHSLDRQTGTLHLGSGQSTVAEPLNDVLVAEAGLGFNQRYTGDGGSAAMAHFEDPKALATGPDGSIYVADEGDFRARRVMPDGTIATIAGTGVCCSPLPGFEGQPAATQRNKPTGLASAPDGTIYLGDSRAGRVYAVRDGKIRTFAGTTGGPATGDGGPALAATMASPLGLAVGPDGSVYIADDLDHRVRRVAADGTISTVAGNGTAGFSGDGGAATAAQLSNPTAVAVLPDGALLVADTTNDRVRRVKDGTITTVAGGGTGTTVGDGGPATSSKMDGPRSLTVAPDGTWWVVEVFGRAVRRIGADGVITTVVNTSRLGASSAGQGDGGPATAARLSGPRGITRTADGTLWVAETDWSIVRRVAPDGTIATGAGRFVAFPGDIGDGNQARFAESRPQSVDVGPDGSRYVVENSTDERRVVRRIFPDGHIESIAGAGRGFAGDGGPAAAAKFDDVNSIAVAPDGSYFLSDSGNRRIRKVDPSGVVSTYAGNGADVTAGDGGPATAASLRSPQGLDLGSDGSLYVADERGAVVRRIGPDGIITTVAGTGNSSFLPAVTEGPATAMNLRRIRDVAVAADGSLYLADEFVGIRRVGSDGQIVTMAGGGFEEGESIPGRTTNAQPIAVTVAPDGTVYYADAQGIARLVRKLTPDGLVTTVAGNPDDDKLGFDPNGPARSQRLPAAFWNGLALDEAGRLLVATDSGAYLLRVQTSIAGAATGEAVVPYDNTLLVFDAKGRHLRTVDDLTGAVLRSFRYDAAGRLVAIDDVDGLRTTITRDGAGRITAVVAPGGQRTAVTTSPDGLPTAVADDAGRATTFTYAPEAMLATTTSPGGGVHTYTYDAAGRLVADRDPVGAVQQLGRVRDATGWTVTLRSPLGHDTTFRYEARGADGSRRVRRDPSGAQTTTTREAGSSTITTTAPDRTSVVERLGPDPRFGPAVSVLASRTRSSPAGKVEELTETRTVTLSQPGNLLSIQRLETATTVNGRTSRSLYEGSTRRLTRTSGEGRVRATVLDPSGRVVREEAGPGLAPTIITYDASGRRTRVEQASRASTFAWDARNRLVSITDAAGHQERFEYDAADQLVAAVSPGGGRTRYTYDADGYRTSVTVPSGAVIGESVDRRGLPAGVDPPGAGNYTTDRAADGAITSRTLPGGRSMGLAYDTKGRLASTTDDTGTTTITYEAAVPNRVAAHSRTIGAATQRTAYGYDGPLVTSMASTGPAAGTYAYTYAADYRRTGSTLTVGATTIAQPLEIDRDGAIAKDGPFTVQRDTFAAAPTGMGDGTGATGYSYDAEGRLTGRTLTVGGTSWSSSLTWDPAGRITREVEVAGGTTTTEYTYDPDGQLLQVSRNGAVVESYGWNADGWRANGATYDALGQLTSLGGTARTSTADGALATRGGDTFAYGPQGELISATVGGTTVTYGYDARNRRTSRTEGGQTTAYLYGDLAHGDRITASVAPDGTVTTYTYDDYGHLVSFSRGATRWYVGTDQVGTPRVVLDAGGAVVEQRRADAFGVPQTATGPGAGLPLGFAGGLADPVTGLVRFGTRDYDPAAGRFTTPDPILLDSGTPDLFGWVGGNPVSRRDVSGRKDGFFSELGEAIVDTVTDLVTDAATNAAADAAGEIVGQELVENAQTVKSTIDDLKAGKNPMRNEYEEQLERSREQAEEGSSSLFDPLKRLWDKCVKALAGESTETGDKEKADPQKPPKSKGLKIYGTTQTVPASPPASLQRGY